MHTMQKELRKYAKPEKVAVYQNFFKTGKGEYGEGDVFIGVTVPDTRKVAKKFVGISFPELEKVLKSKVHEDRLCGLLVLTYKFEQATEEKEQKRIVGFYVKQHHAGNNWDLVDCIADKILGPWLLERDKELLYTYAHSSDLWERRISIITTFHFIKQHKFLDTFKLADILQKDEHDLIHKAVGWMLREVGKRDREKLERFLKSRYKKMPRTMLRYAIEKFPEKQRKAYLSGNI